MARRNKKINKLVSRLCSVCGGTTMATAKSPVVNYSFVSKLEMMSEVPWTLLKQLFA